MTGSPAVRGNKILMEVMVSTDAARGDATPAKAPSKTGWGKDAWN